MAVSQFTLYQSTDGSAPSLTGQTGSLVAVLDAILINGYGAKSAAGWSTTFTASGKRNYKMASGTGFQIFIDDTGPGVGTFKEARITGFETASALGVGTGQFPTAAQGVASPGFQVARKSTTADGTARAWFCFADGRTFYFGAQTGDSTGFYMMFAFGDTYSLASGDTWNCMIIGRNSENSAVLSTENFINSVSLPTTTTPGHYMARTFGGGGASIQFSKQGDFGKGGGATMSNAAAPCLATPNGADNAYYTSPVWVMESVIGGVRGRMRGLWNMCHASTSFSDGQTFSGTGDVSGRSFMFRRDMAGGAAALGGILFETSNTVETN